MRLWSLQHGVRAVRSGARKLQSSKGLDESPLQRRVTRTHKDFALRGSRGALLRRRRRGGFRTETGRRLGFRRLHLRQKQRRGQLETQAPHPPIQTKMQRQAKNIASEGATSQTRFKQTPFKAQLSRASPHDPCRREGPGGRSSREESLPPFITPERSMQLLGREGKTGTFTASSKPRARSERRSRRRVAQRQDACQPEALLSRSAFSHTGAVPGDLQSFFARRKKESCNRRTQRLRGHWTAPSTRREERRS